MNKKVKKETKTLAEVEESLVKKNEELISDKNVLSMKAEDEQAKIDTIKEAFEKTEINEEEIDDGLEHIDPEEIKDTAIEPIKEILEEAIEIQDKETELLDSLKTSEPKKAEEEISKQISKVEEFNKKLQESAKNITSRKITYSWNGATYPF